MNALRQFFTLVVGAAVIQGCSRPQNPEAACAFVQNSELQRVSWSRELPIHLVLHKSVPPTAYAAIDKAVQEYNLRLGRGNDVFKIVERGGDGPRSPEQDGRNVIYWMNTWDPNRTGEQARTTIHWVGTHIFEADIRINAANFSYNLQSSLDSSEVDLTSLLVHELGHALGLAHNVTHGSVMNISLAKGQDRRDLGVVDLDNLQCEY